jgi:lipopolysaccharide transport system ATP-binding protein
MAAIVVTNLSKAYKLYQSRWGRLLNWVFPMSRARYEERWVLRDVNFTVPEGKALGIIGMNGAGKSTLLKMIVGTSIPSTGSVHLNGSVAALLELGMGFHPDCTGRENAIMSLQMQGLNNAQINALLPGIELFSEIGDYFDLPVRVYSSGMQVRLAFAVATSYSPDILIVDEALSVGDAYFQHKSFQRIRQLRKQGTTILLVSHDKSVIQAICDRAILLNDGHVALEGDPETVMNHYNALLAQRDDQAVQHIPLEQSQAIQVVSGSGQININAVQILDREGKRAELLEVGRPVSLHIQLEAVDTVSDLVVGYSIKDRLGQDIFGTNTAYLNYALPSLTAKKMVTIVFDFELNIGPGNYSVTVAVHGAESHIDNNYQWKDLALVFTVINRDHYPFVGVAFIPPSVRMLP